MLGGLTSAYLVFGIFEARVTYPGAASKPVSNPLHLRGAMHVHTVRSDGRGTVDEIAAAAKEAGLDFVLVTDHDQGHPVPQPPEYIGGVLMVDGIERTIKAGHRVEFGDIHIAAHPLNRRRPYTTLGKEDLTGMEVLSGDDLWRDALVAPFNGFIQGVLVFPFSPQHAVMQVAHWPDRTIRRWMDLAATKPLVGTCSIDAHGYPDYVDVFRALQIHVLVDARLDGDANLDSKRLLDALSQGRVWCSLQPVADGGGFSFEARQAMRGHPMGSRVKLADKPTLVASVGLEPLPPGTKLVLYRGMDPVATAAAGELEFTPTEPGPYRIEASYEGRSLFGRPEETKALYANPIYVE